MLVSTVVVVTAAYAVVVLCALLVKRASAKVRRLNGRHTALRRQLNHALLLQVGMCGWRGLPNFPFFCRLLSVLKFLFLRVPWFSQNETNKSCAKEQLFLQADSVSDTNSGHMTSRSLQKAAGEQLTLWILTTEQGV